MRWIALVLFAACSGKSSDTSQDTTDTSSNTGDTSSDTGDSAADTGDTSSTDTCASYEAAVQAGTISDDTLDEISGMVVSRANPGWLWVLEDSGATALLAAIDTTGARVATITVDGATNVDWEDLAIGPCGAGTEGACLYIADIGDNDAIRVIRTIYRIPEPTTPSARVTAEAMEITYPSGAADAEAFVVYPDGVMEVLTKRLDTTLRIQFPAFEAGVSVEGVLLEELPKAQEGLAGMVTAADVSADGRRLVVRGYQTLEAWTLDDDKRHIGDPLTIPPPLELQGESVAVDPVDTSIWLVSEFADAPLWHLSCAP